MAGSQIQFQFPWGLETIETVNSRGDKTVKEGEETLGKSFQVNPSEKKTLSVLTFICSRRLVAKQDKAIVFLFYVLQIFFATS